jgi:hypothetical protein
MSARTHRVELIGGGVALVDLRDRQLVAEYTCWRAGGTGNRYAVALVKIPNGKRGGSLQTIYLHRLIAGAAPGDIVDHRDGDELNCRRENLRIGTIAQNCANRRGTTSATGYRGVAYYPKKRKFRATVTKEDAAFRGPYRSDAVQAAHDADALMRGLHGAWATYNFPRADERGVLRLVAGGA